MNLQKMKAWSALLSVIFATLFTASIITGIWLEFKSETIWKLISTFFILFFLFLLTHTIMQGMTKDSKEQG